MQQRYRIFIDESGHHQMKKFPNTNERFFCLMGCWMPVDDHYSLATNFRELRRATFNGKDPDETYLHRTSMRGRRIWYADFVNDAIRIPFEQCFLETIDATNFTFVAVVIDKKRMKEVYTKSTPPHPYRLAMEFMMERFCGFLNAYGFLGDICAESRGRDHDDVLQREWNHIYKHGNVYTPSAVFQSALTSPIIDFRVKHDNIAGLQVSDHSVAEIRSAVLLHRRLVSTDEIKFDVFQNRLLEILRAKVNVWGNRVGGYGIKFFPDF